MRDVTRCTRLLRDRRNTPCSARLFDSVAPEVNTIRSLGAPTRAATAARAASTSSRARRPAGKFRQPLEQLHVIRKGAARLEREGQTLQLLEEGELFGYTSLLSGAAPLDVVGRAAGVVDGQVDQEPVLAVVLVDLLDRSERRFRRVEPQLARLSGRTMAADAPRLERGRYECLEDGGGTWVHRATRRARSSGHQEWHPGHVLGQVRLAVRERLENRPAARVRQRLEDLVLGRVPVAHG